MKKRINTPTTPLMINGVAWEIVKLFAQHADSHEVMPDIYYAKDSGELLKLSLVKCYPDMELLEQSLYRTVKEAVRESYDRYGTCIVYHCPDNAITTIENLHMEDLEGDAGILERQEIPGFYIGFD